MISHTEGFSFVKLKAYPGYHTFFVSFACPVKCGAYFTGMYFVVKKVFLPQRGKTIKNNFKG